VPETEWRYGYFAFWGVALCLAATLVTFMRRRRWL
jgi:Mg2+ and Co2+ transporter CorA